MIMAPAQSTFLWEQNIFVVEADLYKRVRRTDLPEEGGTGKGNQYHENTYHLLVHGRSHR